VVTLLRLGRSPNPPESEIKRELSKRAQDGSAQRGARVRWRRPARVEHETEREAGTDEYALGDWDAAVSHCTPALAARPEAATLSNRAATYLAKDWHAQALAGAEGALALRPGWARAYARRGAALAGLGRAAESAAAYREAACLKPGDACRLLTTGHA
jgi:tetratricopeptide (TPR) repeat protein